MRKNIYTSFAIIALLCSACNKEKHTISIDQDEITIQHDGTLQLKISPSQTCTWSTDDNNVATVSVTGLVTGVRIGDTKINAISAEYGISASCIVHVTPKSTLYTEPYFIYGSSISTIKSKETRTLYYDTSTALMFTGENTNVRFVAYLFNSSGLSSADVLLANLTSVVKEVVTFIEERYIFYGYIDGYAMYKDINGDCVVINVDNTLGLNVLYFRPTSTTTKKGVDEFQQLKSQFINILK